MTRNVPAWRPHARRPSRSRPGGAAGLWLLAFVVAISGACSGSGPTLLVPTESTFVISPSSDARTTTAVTVTLRLTSDDWTLAAAEQGSGTPGSDGEPPVCELGPAIAPTTASGAAAAGDGSGVLVLDAELWRSASWLDAECSGISVSGRPWSVRTTIAYDANSLSECIEDDDPRFCAGDVIDATAFGSGAIPMMEIAVDDGPVSIEAGIVVE